jgi:preprotein translocase subunit SecA
MDWDQLSDKLQKFGSDIGRGLKGVFGSRNERVVKKLVPLVQAINSHEVWAKSLSAEQFQAQTAEWKRQVAEGEVGLDELLPKAFALVREASVRTLGMRHFDVQMVGGIILHQGAIAEMCTGEGKTLVATLPLYLNCLSGETVYLVTVNDYLARRDASWMGPIFDYLGVAVAAIQSDMTPWERQPVYMCDIVYGTNSEFGFDYLRDNMKSKTEEQVQKILSFAIVDEVDSILIDEARTPLIISGPAQESGNKYALADQIARTLKKDEHYEVKEKERQVVLKEAGIDAAERMVGVPSFFQPPHEDWPHFIENALRAHNLYQLNKEYVSENGEIVIVDEFTGRKMHGRRWSEGLHQAVEVKEGLPPRQENQTLATITYQNYFRMFKKLAGMTGTAVTEAGEFLKIYNLDVLSVPTNLPIARKDVVDTVYRTADEKWAAIVQEIEDVHGGREAGRKDHEDKPLPALKPGQPILVGTTSIEKSEHLSKLLSEKKIPHNVLNAKNHEREAMIVALAGEKGAVTVATNMAGRGTDIKLGGNFEYRLNKALEESGLVLGDLEKLAEIDAKRKHVRAQCDKDEAEVLALGGLYVLGTERHEARRIDNQLRGRSGRQGNAGRSRFYLSLEDDLMRIFYRDWVKNFMEKLGMKQGVPIESGMVTRAIERAQRKVEDRNFEIRKNLLEYDDVMDKQRKTIYGVRQDVLEGKGLKERVVEMIGSSLRRNALEIWHLDAAGFQAWFLRQFGFELPLELAKAATDKNGDPTPVLQLLEQRYTEREAGMGDAMMRQVERYILLNAIDQRWKDHLYAIDSLKHGIHLRAYAQQDPKNIYKQEGFALFQKLFATIEDEVSSLVMRIEVRRSENAPAAAAPRAPIRPAVPASMAFDLARRQQPRPGNPPRPS